MVIKIPDIVNNLCIVSDVHGAWNKVEYHIRHFKVKNTAFIFCGDVGIGFEKLSHYTNNVIPSLNKTLKKYNCYWYWIRGNHDSPDIFNNYLINTKYVKAVPDYTILQFNDKNILCIGGGISVDRYSRKNDNSLAIVDYIKWHNCSYEEAEVNARKCYWENEIPIYQPKVDERIDIICSHSAPSFCFPSFKGSFVLNWAEYDKDLLSDLDKERAVFDAIYNDYKDTLTHWYYGHFHKSNYEIINNTKFRLLNIGEIYQHVTDDNYSL